VILKLEDHAAPYIFVSASVGDCKAFHISEKTGYISPRMHAPHAPHARTGF